MGYSFTIQFIGPHPKHYEKCKNDSHSTMTMLRNTPAESLASQLLPVSAVLGLVFAMKGRKSAIKIFHLTFFPSTG